MISYLIFAQANTTKDSLKETNCKQNIESSSDSTNKELVGYPVISENDTLFYVYTGVLNYTPQQRAQIISKKIDYLKSDNSH